MNSTTVTTLCNFVSPQIQECCVWDHINRCGCVWSIRQISGETNWESWACLPGMCVWVTTKCGQSVNLWGLCGLQLIDIDSMHMQVVGWAWATPTLACWMLSFFLYVTYIGRSVCCGWFSQSLVLCSVSHHLHLLSSLNK